MNGLNDKERIKLNQSFFGFGFTIDLSSKSKGVPTVSNTSFQSPDRSRQATGNRNFFAPGALATYMMLHLHYHWNHKHLPCAVVRDTLNTFS